MEHGYDGTDSDRTEIKSGVALSLLLHHLPATLSEPTPTQLIWQHIENTHNMAHRKIDIDALDADQFMDDEELAVQAPTTAPTTDDGEGGSSGTMRATVTNIVLEGPRPAADVERAATARAAAVRSELSR